jgi:hypothetical protein
MIVSALAVAAAIPNVAAACGAVYEECCTTGAACGDHLACDRTCVVQSTGIACGSSWTTSPGVCTTTFPPPTTPTGICAPDELQCGIDCGAGDYDVGPICVWGGPNGATVFSECFSDYEGPFYACPAGAVDGGGTRFVCTYVNNDSNNCGSCGVVCPEGTWCSSGACR